MSCGHFANAAIAAQVVAVAANATTTMAAVLAATVERFGPVARYRTWVTPTVEAVGVP